MVLEEKENSARKREKPVKNRFLHFDIFIDESKTLK